MGDAGAPCLGAWLPPSCRNATEAAGVKPKCPQGLERADMSLPVWKEWTQGVRGSPGKRGGGCWVEGPWGLLFSLPVLIAQLQVLFLSFSLLPSLLVPSFPSSILSLCRTLVLGPSLHPGLPATGSLPRRQPPRPPPGIPAFPAHPLPLVPSHDPPWFSQACC